MALHAYLPQDRLHALALDPEGALPERAQGAVLFADVTGFTALTEALKHSLGERPGIEALSQQMTEVYEALVGQVEVWGGSVIGFAGDAITCWFDQTQGDAALRAVVCAQDMQAAMQQFPSLSLKVGVASGPAKRFVIGLKSQGKLDVLAGGCVTRAATGEGLAQAGQVLLDQPTAALLKVPKGATREAGSGERFFLLDAAWAPPARPTAPRLAPSPPLPPERLKPWVLPFVWAREADGADLFATDLRPATALFLRFGGLDFDRDDQAPAALSALVLKAQGCIEDHGGVLLELTLGDKGSYLYANFGAAQVHEDDPQRALRAALALRAAFADTTHEVQIGLSCGTLRVGGYGSRTRQSFGAQGDEVNAAARLMGIARAGEILLTGRLRQSIGNAFAMEARPPMPMKGKAEPIAVFAVTGVLRQRAVRLQEPEAKLPMVGRDAEVAWFERKFSVAQRGQGQVLGLCAEPGMGKSRLAAEAVRIANRHEFSGYGGRCAVEDIPTPYLVWQSIWAALFDVDPSWPVRKQLRAVEAQLREHAPAHVDALPLLGRVLGLNWPDNAWTAALTPQDSKAVLEAALLECLGAMVREAEEDGMGLLLVLEDLHAIDPLSLDLLMQVMRAAAAWPMLVLLTYRPMNDAHGQALLDGLEGLHHFEDWTLGALAAPQTEQLIRAKLSQLFPERVGPVPPVLIERVTAQAQGNPFYAEELLNYLHDRGLDPRQIGPKDVLALPASLHSLVLSRIDRLLPTQQHTLKVASVIGRLFKAADLHGYHPALGDAERLRHDLAELDRLGFTPQLPDEAELSFLFKQLVTLEAGYESMSHGTRQALHAELARFLEARDPGLTLTSAAQLAHHYDCAGQSDKACHYLILAGEQAAAQFANDEALSCYERALNRLPDGEAATRWMLLQRREALFDLLGQHEAQSNALALMDALANGLTESALRRAEIALRRAKLANDLSDYPAAQQQAQQALAQLDAHGVPSAEADRLRVDALLSEARTLFFQGDAGSSRPQLDRALALAQACAYARGEYNTLAQFGLMHWQFGDFDSAEAHLRQALTRIEAAGDLRRQMDILNNLGVVANGQANPAKALQYYEQAEALAQRMGDRSGVASLLNNQGTACLRAGDYMKAHQRAERAVASFEALHESTQQGMSLITLGEALREMGQLESAFKTAHQALSLLKASGSRRGEAIVLENLGLIHAARGEPEEAVRRTAEALNLAEATNANALALSNHQQLARLHLQGNALAAAGASLDAADTLLQARDEWAPALIQHVLRAHWWRLQTNTAAALEVIAPFATAMLTAPEARLQAIPLWSQAMAIELLDSAADARAKVLRQRAEFTLRLRADRIAEASWRQSYLALEDHRPLLPR